MRLGGALRIAALKPRQSVKTNSFRRICVVEGDLALQKKLRHPEYLADVERAILFTIEAWDVNRPQHIHPRFSQRQIAPVIEKLQERVAELEAEIERLRSTSEGKR